MGKAAKERKPELSELIAQLHEAKQMETKAKDFRLMIEDSIIDQVGTKLEEGTNRFGEKSELKVVCGYTRKWDDEKILNLMRQHPDQPWPFKHTVKEDLRASRALEKSHPDMVKFLEKEALTMKPKKPTISIDEKKLKGGK